MDTFVRDIYLNANGLRHHVIARGSQADSIVMMIHGLTQQAHVFDGIAATLAEDHHVYCMDVRGRGESEWGPTDGYHMVNYVADLEAVREVLGVERMSLVGTSMGGLISMHYAAQYPDRVDRVVTNDIGPEIAPEGLARIREMAANAPEGFADLRAVAKYYREHNAPVLGRRSEDDIIEYARWHVRRNDIGVYVWKMDPSIRQPVAPPVEQPDAWASYRSLHCPVMVVRGADSDVLGPETAQEMREALPAVTTVEVPGVGHAPSLDEPEAREALGHFLAGHG